LLRTLISIFLLFILVAAAWLAWALWLPLQPSAPKYVLLRPGWSVRHISNELHAQGVIRSVPAFLLWHYVAQPRSLKAGEYKFDQPAAAVKVHDRLVRGDILIHTVVVPEGFNMFDVANALEAAGLGSKQEFLKVARENVSLISDLDPQARTLEGYLFPDTYQFTRTQSSGDMIAAMVRRFRQEAQAMELKSDVHRVVTMASIVEKETAAADERPTVAAVYYNRLARNIALAADPSVIYASLLAGRYDGVIHVSDLQSDSPYNTYKHAGLPPGPIANPGRASLQAAMHPAQSDFLYFVSDNQGRHRFARTLDEHSRNVAAYRRALAGAR
jgi:UPF0755 protein